MKKFILFSIAIVISCALISQSKFNGIDENMSNLYRFSDAKTRSIKS